MKTRYLILKADPDAAWADGATVEASSAESAIRTAATEHGEGTYAAVPERSWTQRTVTVETTTRVRLGETA